MEKQEKGGKSGFSVGEKESVNAELGRLLSRGRPDLVGREKGIELVASIANVLYTQAQARPKHALHDTSIRTLHVINRLMYANMLLSDRRIQATQLHFSIAVSHRQVGYAEHTSTELL